jgi:hypothetical protein
MNSGDPEALAVPARMEQRGVTLDTNPVIIH